MFSAWNPATGYRRYVTATALALYLLLTLLPLTLPFLKTGWQTGQDAGPAINLLGRSLYLAALAATIAVGMGFFAGIGLWHTRTPVYQLRTLLIMTLLLPPYLLIQGWMSLAWSPLPGLSFIKTPAGVTWAALILGTSLAPLAATFIAMARRFLPLTSLESIALSQGPSQTCRRIIWPTTLPLLAAAWLLIAMLCLLEGGVPLSLQFPVFATEITSRFLGGENPVSLAQNVWPLYLSSLLLGTCAFLAGTRLKTGGENDFPDKQHFLLHPDALPTVFRWICKFSWLLLGVLIALPLIGLLRLAFSTSVYHLSMNSDGASLLRSLVLAGASAAAAAVLAVPAAASINKTKWLWFVALLPLAIPASITGITWAAWGVRIHACCNWLPEATTLFLSHISRILPFVLLISMALWQSRQLQTAREAVFLHSRHFWQQLRVEWPHYLLVFLVGLVFSLRELEISLLTVPPGGETLPIRVFNLLHYGAGADVARLSLLLAFPIAIAAFGIMRKLEHTR